MSEKKSADSEGSGFLKITRINAFYVRKYFADVSSFPSDVIIPRHSALLDVCVDLGNTIYVRIGSFELNIILSTDIYTTLYVGSADCGEIAASLR